MIWFNSMILSTATILYDLQLMFTQLPIYILRLCAFIPRFLWTLPDTSRRRTLRPTTTQWTLQMRCHWGLWRPRQQLRTSKTTFSILTTYTSGPSLQIAFKWTTISSPICHNTIIVCYPMHLLYPVITHKMVWNYVQRIRLV